MFLYILQNEDKGFMGSTTNIPSWSVFLFSDQQTKALEYKYKPQMKEYKYNYIPTCN